MSTQWQREVEFRGAPVLDEQLARPVKRAGAAKGQPGGQNGGEKSATPAIDALLVKHAVAPKLAKPAAAPAPAPREGGALTPPSTKPPTRAGPTAVAASNQPPRVVRTGAGPGTREPAPKPLADHGAPASAEYRRALADYSAYLAAVSELNAARVAAIVADKALGAARAAVEKAVAALGEDPLRVVVGPPPAWSQAAAPPAPGPSPRGAEILALLPGKPSDISARHGAISVDAVRQVLYDLERRGLVRRGAMTQSDKRQGRPTHVWFRADDDGGPV